MKVFRGVSAFHSTKKNAVTWGVFDGLHMGHQHVISVLKNIAAVNGLKTLILTFDKHPMEVLRGQVVPLLYSLDDRLRLLESTGIDYVVVEPFTKSFSHNEPAQFINEIVIRRLNASAVVLGFDSRFGRDRKGSFDWLEKNFSKSLIIEKAGTINFDGRPFGSTLIRQLISEGKIVQANAVLGRMYSVRGRIVRGAGRGSKIGIPTGNVHVLSGLVPAVGVYCGTVKIGAESFNCVTNVGVRPTFTGGKAKPVVEFHALDFSGESLLGKEVELSFYARIRDEKKFASPTELVKQIKKDIEYSRALMENRQ